MSAEQLFATSTRLFQETSIRSGQKTGDVVEPPFSDGAVARTVLKFDQKTTPFRHKLARNPLHEAFQLRASFEVGPEFLAFLIEPHLRAGVSLDHNSPDPTFSLQVESEDGDRFAFNGLAVREIQISFVARGVLTLNVGFVALDRVQLSGSLEEITLELPPNFLAGRQCDVVGKSGALADRDSDRLPARTAELFIRRDLSAAQFEADGRPSRFNRGPWRAIGEIVTPADAFTESASNSFVDGSAAFFLGEPGSEIQIQLDNSVRFLTDTDPLKADDFRDHRVIFEAEPDSSGSILTFKNNL